MAILSESALLGVTAHLLGCLGFIKTAVDTKGYRRPSDLRGGWN